MRGVLVLTIADLTQTGKANHSSGIHSHDIIVNKGQRIVEIEQDSVKKYIQDRQKRLSHVKENAFVNANKEISQINPKLTIKQRVRTEMMSRPSIEQIEIEAEDINWHRNFTMAEKKTLLNNLMKNYQKFKKITDHSVENNRYFMPMPPIQRPVYSAKTGVNLAPLKQEKLPIEDNKILRAKTCSIYAQGEDRIRRIFTGKHRIESLDAQEKEIIKTEISIDREIKSQKPKRQVLQVFE